IKEHGRSNSTFNSHRQAIRSFTRWLASNDRIPTDTLGAVTPLNLNEDRRHDRRTLSVEELQRLIRAAHDGTPFRKMTGPLRALCYRMAASTGLRYSELASLTPRSIDLDSKPAKVCVKAEFTKNREKALLTIPDDVAEDLRPHVATLKRDEPVFPLAKDSGARMLRLDLEAAGIAYRDDAG